VIASPICFKPMLGDYDHHIMRLFRHYKRGNLLITGGVMDQPNAYLQMMEQLEDRLGHD